MKDLLRTAEEDEDPQLRSGAQELATAIMDGDIPPPTVIEQPYGSNIILIEHAPHALPAQMVCGFISAARPDAEPPEGLSAALRSLALNGASWSKESVRVFDGVPLRSPWDSIGLWQTDKPQAVADILVPPTVSITITSYFEDHEALHTDIGTSSGSVSSADAQLAEHFQEASVEIPLPEGAGKLGLKDGEKTARTTTTTGGTGLSMPVPSVCMNARWWWKVEVTVKQASGAESYDAWLDMGPISYTAVNAKGR